MEFKGNILTHAAGQKAAYVTSTGSANAYAVSVDSNVAALTAGLKVVFQANFANTGAATLNVNSLGAVSITKNVSSALGSGDIALNQIVTVIYDGTNFQMSGGAGGGSGSSGSSGATGSSGTSGNSGSSGTSGNTGSSGSSGATGSSGSSGNSGAAGSSGTSGQSGSSGLSKPASITLTSPTTGDIDLFYNSGLSTTVAILADTISGANPSVTYNIKWGATRDAASPTSLLAANRTVSFAGTGTSAGSTTATFANATIPANNWVWLSVTATSGTVDSCGINLILS